MHNRLMKAGLFLLISLLCLGCSSESGPPSDSGDAGFPVLDAELSPGILGLPGIAALDGLLGDEPFPRDVSSQNPEFAGSEYLSGKNVSRSGSNALFQAGPGEAAWAVYRLEMCNCDVVEELSFTLSSRTAGKGVWIALPDYSQGRWTFIGPEETDVKTFMPEIPSEALLSPAGYVYMALIAWDDCAWTVEKVGVKYPDPAIPGWIHALGNGQAIGGDVYPALLTGAPDGSIYVAGYYRQTPAEEFKRLLLAHYAADGSLLQTKSWEAPGSASTKGVWIGGLCCDELGSVYVSLTCFEQENFDGDCALLKFSGQLDLQWQKKFHPTDGLSDELDGLGEITRCPNGNLVCIGNTYSYSAFGNTTYFLVEFDPLGALVRARRTVSEIVDEAGARDFNPGSMSIAADTGIVFAGALRNASDQSDALITSLDSNWDVSWSKSWDGGDNESLSGIARTGAGAIYAYGYSQNGSGLSQLKSGVLLLMLSPEGVLDSRYVMGNPLATQVSVHSFEHLPGGGWQSRGSIRLTSGVTGEAEFLFADDLNPVSYNIFSPGSSETLHLGDTYFSALMQDSLCVDDFWVVAGSGFIYSQILVGSSELGDFGLDTADMVLDWSDASGLAGDPQVLQDVPESSSLQLVTVAHIPQ